MAGDQGSVDPESREAAMERFRSRQAATASERDAAFEAFRERHRQERARDQRQEEIRRLAQWIDSELSRDGDPKRVAIELVNSGVAGDFPAAYEFVINTKTALHNARINERRRRIFKNLVLGSATLVAAVAISFATYAWASRNPAGGTYFVAYGAALYGASRMVLGLRELLFGYKPELGQQFANRQEETPPMDYPGLSEGEARLVEDRTERDQRAFQSDIRTF